MPLARPEPCDCRVIAHVDMDCFYVQVEQRRQPELKEKPTAVVQYNEWKGGGLIAVSYEARALGVSRHMRGDEAKQVCPEICLVQVPVARGKADLSTYRNAGSEVVSILSQKGICERASIDEVYLDLTESSRAMLASSPPERFDKIPAEALKSHIIGLPIEVEADREEKVREWLCKGDAYDKEKLLSCGAFIVAQLRMQVLEMTGFTCSAGIAHNKMLAKLASGMNKPGKQTIVPTLAVSSLLDPLPIMKMKQLGGKLGFSLKTDMGITTVGNLLQFSEDKLQQHYGSNTGTWLWKMARGIDVDEVQDRLLPKSHGSGKSFPGPRALKTLSSVQHWLNQLGEELSERVQSDLNENKRIAHTLTLHATAIKNVTSDCDRKFPSKSCPLRYGTYKIRDDAYTLFQAALREFIGGGYSSGWAVTSLSISAGKISDIPSGTSSIMRYFSCKNSTSPCLKQDSSNSVSDSLTADQEAYPRCVTSNNVEKGPQVQHENGQLDKNLIATSAELSSTSESRSYKRGMSPYTSAAPKKNRKGEEGGPIHRFFSGKLSASNRNPVDSCEGESSTYEGENSSNAAINKRTWGRNDQQPYNADEIDYDVIRELPPSIQQELKTWLSINKPQCSRKRKSTISHYFSPFKSHNSSLL